MIEANCGQMPAGGPPGQHDRPGDTVCRPVLGQPVQCCADFADDLGDRRVRCQAVARQRCRPAPRIGAADQIGELVLAVALPVAAVDEHHARRPRVPPREQIPCIALARSVTQIEMLGMRGAEGCRCRLACRMQRRAVLHRVAVVVGRVALRAAQRAPVHAVACKYQSMICRPCQNSVPGFAAI